MHHNYRLCASSRAKAAEAAAPSSDHPDPSRARAQIVCRRDAAALARSAPTARRREHGLPGGEPLSAIPPTPAQVSAAQLRRSANRRVVPARCTPATFGGGRSCHGPRSNAKNGLTGTLQGAISGRARSSAASAWTRWRVDVAGDPSRGGSEPSLPLEVAWLTSAPSIVPIVIHVIARIWIAMV